MYRGSGPGYAPPCCTKPNIVRHQGSPVRRTVHRLFKNGCNCLSVLINRIEDMLRQDDHRDVRVAAPCNRKIFVQQGNRPCPRTGFPISNQLCEGKFCLPAINKVLQEVGRLRCQSQLDQRTGLTARCLRRVQTPDLLIQNRLISSFENGILSRQFRSTADPGDFSNAVCR